MPRLPRIAAVLALLIAAPAPSVADSTAGTPAQVRETAASSAAAPVLRRPERRRSPLAVAMAGIAETEKVAIQRLEQRLASERDPVALESLHREIEQVKLDTEVQLLSLQATHHRQHGRLDIAAQLDDAVAALRAPRRVIEPAARPAPAPTTR